MSDVLLTSMIEIMDAHERKMEELSAKVNAIVDYTETLDVIVNSADEIKTHLQKTSFPEREMDILCGYLASAIALLKQPVTQKVIHEHHASTILWATIVLFIVECVTVVGWYRAEDSLALYRANDTKYRYLKLNANQSLYKALTSVDSLYIKDEKMREHVLATEERNEKAFQLMQQAIQMEKEARQLKQQAVQKQGNQRMAVLQKPLKLLKESK
jgi:hypothetical protein